MNKLFSLSNIAVELEKRFSKNGKYRANLNRLKALKKKYPKDEIINKFIKAYKQKIYGVKGSSFLLEQVADFFDSRLLFRDDFFEVEGIKFIPISQSEMKAFRFELIDLLYNDEYFGKSKKNDLFCQIMACFQFEGPYQRNSVFLQPNDVVIDAGANMGMFSIMANHFYDCKCYAFEPIKSTIRLLEGNIRLNQMEKAIEVVQYALSNVEGDIEFQVNPDESHISSSMIDRRINMEVEIARGISLDQWAQETNIQKIDFIKADIEGAERYMLSGATEVLKKFAPKLSICTYHLPDDPQVLEDIILKANPNYKIEHTYTKLYAHVPKVG